MGILKGIGSRARSTSPPTANFFVSPPPHFSASSALTDRPRRPPSEARKPTSLRPREAPFSPVKFPLLRTRIPSGFARRQISAYKKIYFRIYEKIFSHMQKFIFVRTEINFLPQGNKFSCGRKNIFLRKKIFRPAEGEYSPFGRGDFFVRKEGNFSSDKSSPPCGRTGTFPRRKITFPR